MKNRYSATCVLGPESGKLITGEIVKRDQYAVYIQCGSEVYMCNERSLVINED